MYCRVFSSISGLFPGDAGSIIPVGTIKNVSRHYQTSLGGGGGGSPLAENHWMKQIFLRTQNV